MKRVGHDIESRTIDNSKALSNELKQSFIGFKHDGCAKQPNKIEHQSFNGQDNSLQVIQLTHGTLRKLIPAAGLSPYPMHYHSLNPADLGNMLA